MKIYSLDTQSSSLDEDVRIKVTETKEVDSYTSVSNLKRKYERALEEIARQKEIANQVIDEMTAINADEKLDIEIKDIPKKLS